MLSRFGEWLVAKGLHCRVKGKGTKKKVGLTREILKKKKKKKERKQTEISAGYKINVFLTIIHTTSDNFRDS